MKTSEMKEYVITIIEKYTSLNKDGTRNKEEDSFEMRVKYWDPWTVGRALCKEFKENNPDSRWAFEVREVEEEK